MGSCMYPSAAQGMHIGAADTAMGDLDIDVGLFPWLGLELLPNHLALAGLGTEAHPALELVITLAHCENMREVKLKLNRI